MKLSYFDSISPVPIYIKGIGGIISPKLKDIASLGFNTYHYYLSIITMDLKEYFVMMGLQSQYEELTDEEKNQLNIFELLIMDESTRILLEKVLNFFLNDTVVYSPENYCFFVKNNDTVIGSIDKQTYPQVCDLISQRNCIKNQREDLTNVKSKKALEIMKKLKKGREKIKKQSQVDKNMELGNIISSVANKSSSLNILNIWDLTVFQIWDCFARLSNNNIYNIQSMSVATWGDKDNHFDASAWFKKIDI